MMVDAGRCAAAYFTRSTETEAPIDENGRCLNKATFYVSDDCSEKCRTETGYRIPSCGVHVSEFAHRKKTCGVTTAFPIGISPPVRIGGRR